MLRTSDELEALEAAARILMSKIASKGAARGFDTLRERSTLIAQLDRVLDKWLGHDTTPAPAQRVIDPNLRVYLDHAETGNPSSRECGVCGRSRYVNTTGTRMCIACDGVATGSWAVADDDY